MKLAEIGLCFVLALSSAHTGAGEPSNGADLKDRNYHVIVERNPFGLKPAATSTPVSTTATKERPNLKLTGISTLTAPARAFLVREERGQAPEYLNLIEGQATGGIELRGADVRTGTVHLFWDGQDVFLSFSGQEQEERAAVAAEKQFVQDHTRAHEELQRREKERLEQEAAQPKFPPK